MYLIRLDDACEYRDTSKWDRIERILDCHRLAPLVGVIPACEDESLISAYEKDLFFREKCRQWTEKGWQIAMHGYRHVYRTPCGGINPVQLRSEFAGVPLDEQERMLAHAWQAMRSLGVTPTVFFAPSHTFDFNTLLALQAVTPIRTVCDTPAGDVYSENGFRFIPVLTGSPRRLPFRMVTVCLHPNTMSESEMDALDRFIRKRRKKFINSGDIGPVIRKRSAFDRFLHFCYFKRIMLRRARKTK